MEIKISTMAQSDILRRCADECTINAQKCKEIGLDECALLCIACAAACHKVLVEEKPAIEILEQCADACKACAAECDLHPHQHCMDCAELCRKCEKECRAIIGLKSSL